MSGRSAPGLPPAGRLACRVLFWLTLAGIAFATLSPIDDRPMTPFGADPERAAAFAALSALAMLGYPARRLLWFFAILAVAVALEAGQNLVVGRHGRLPDAEVKALGTFAGAVLALALERVSAVFRPVRP